VSFLHRGVITGLPVALFIEETYLWKYMNPLAHKRSQFQWWNGHLRRITPRKPVHFVLCLLFSPLWVPAVFVLLAITGVLELQIQQLQRSVMKNTNQSGFSGSAFPKTALAYRKREED
jgi:hypothetical protein